MNAERITAIHNMIYGSDYSEESREQLHAALDELVQERTDLLAALEKLVFNFERLFPSSLYPELSALSMFPNDEDRARAAIAKAKGES